MTKAPRPKKWKDGTIKSTDNAFNWNTGEMSVALKKVPQRKR